MTHHSPFLPAHPPRPDAAHSDHIPEKDARVLPFRGDQLLVKATNSGVTLCKAWPRRLPPSPLLLVGHIDRTPCYAALLPPAGPGALAQQGPAGHAFRDLRTLFGLLTENEYACAVTARELLHFDDTTRHCSRCGAPLSREPDRLAKRCGACGHSSQPTVQPVVLLLLHDGPNLLLSQPHGLPADLFSLPALEPAPGESVEQSAARFLDRAFGVSVKHLSYHESQPWPFPDRLLLGFHGHVPQGPLRVDEREFKAARWFPVDELPLLPPPVSMARRMADWYAQLPRQNGVPIVPRHG